MPRSKSEQEIFERLAELDGELRAMKLVLLHQIFQSDAEHRHHAELLNVGLTEDIKKIPAVPPNATMLTALENLTMRIRNIAAGNHQTLDERGF